MAEQPQTPALVEAYLPEADPESVLQRAQARAQALMRVVRERKLSVRLPGGEYLRFEAWQVLGAMYGVTPVVVQLTEERDESGVLVRASARAEARWRGTVVLSAAESECSREEVVISRRTGTQQKRWSHATDAQIKGMAQTRACARALRQCLAWVACLAGYQPTPAEELDQAPMEGVKP